MALMFLADIADVSWWGMKKMYNGGYWLLYGTQESTEEKILKQMSELRNMQPDGTYREELEEKVLAEFKKLHEEFRKQNSELKEQFLAKMSENQKILAQLEQLKARDQEHAQEIAELKSRLVDPEDSRIFDENDYAEFYRLMASDKST